MNVLTARVADQEAMKLKSLLFNKSSEGSLVYKDPEGGFNWNSNNPQATICFTRNQDGSWAASFWGAVLSEQEPPCLVDFILAAETKTLKLIKIEDSMAIFGTIEERGIASASLTPEEEEKLFSFAKCLDVEETIKMIFGETPELVPAL